MHIKWFFAVSNVIIKNVFLFPEVANDIFDRTEWLPEIIIKQLFIVIEKNKSFSRFLFYVLGAIGDQFVLS